MSWRISAVCVFSKFSTNSRKDTADSVFLPEFSLCCSLQQKNSVSYIFSSFKRIPIPSGPETHRYNLSFKMSDDAEQQLEEVEVLKSIYEGDENFKEINSKTYQYKYTDGDKSFILEIGWGPTYPTEKPNFNVDIFYNQHIVPSVKENILSTVNTEAEQWLGCAMTYTLFECLKEKVGEILADQTEEAIVARVEKIVVQDPEEEKKPEAKKEQLTKAQKRRAWDKAEMGKAGEKPRGWDWMDIVKHLSQVPYQPPVTTSS